MVAPTPTHRRSGSGLLVALGFGLLWLLRLASNGGVLLGAMQIVLGVALLCLAVPLTWRLVHQHLLWSLRNKLILTYILIGLAPVVLFVTFAAISAYIAAGQFSIHLADTRMHQQLDEIGVQNSSRASSMSRMMRMRAEQLQGRSPQGPPGPPRRRPQPVGTGARPNTQSRAYRQPQSNIASATESAGQAATQTAELGESAPDPLLARLHRHSAVYLNGAPYTAPQPFTPSASTGIGAQSASAQSTNAVEQLPAVASDSENNLGQSSMPLGLPPWASDLHGLQFRRLVLDGQNLYLVAIDQRHVDGAGLLTVITSLPVDSALMDVVAEGLGRVGVSGLMTNGPLETPAAVRPTANGGGRRSLDNDIDRTTVYGGSEPDPVNILDFEVPFLSTMEIRDWQTGLTDNVPIRVHSRPSMLFRQLFGSSLGSIVTSTYIIGMLSLCILFVLIEALALWAAWRLSRNITTSVEELYTATQRVDRGDFVHRIAAAPVGKRDQLGELARSFNRMTGSLERLLVEQQEKERMQNEL